MKWQWSDCNEQEGSLIYNKARWGIWQRKPIREVVSRQQSELFCHSAALQWW